MMMTDYDFNCMFYLGFEIPLLLGIKDKPLLLDNYYEVVKMIYPKYKECDNLDVSMLTSVDEFIVDNIDLIRAMVLPCIDE